MAHFPIIINGFEKFSAPYSPSADVANYFKKKYIAGQEISATVLPDYFRHAAEQIKYIIQFNKPKVLLSIGPSAHRLEQIDPIIHIEKRAINIMTPEFDRNNRLIPTNDPIDPEGPEFVYLDWDADALASHLTQRGVRARSSDNAGTYVGNDVLYRTLRRLEQAASGVKFGYIQIPWLREYTEGLKGQEFSQISVPIDPEKTMPMKEIVEGVELIVKKMLE